MGCDRVTNTRGKKKKRRRSERRCRLEIVSNIFFHFERKTKKTQTNTAPVEGLLPPAVCLAALNLSGYSATRLWLVGGNRIDDDFSFGCTAGGLSAPVVFPTSSSLHSGYFLFLFAPSQQICVGSQREIMGTVECWRDKYIKGRRRRRGDLKLTSVTLRKNNPK